MAATGAFAVSGLACLVAWTPWAVAYEDKFSVEMANTQGRAERELLFARRRPGRESGAGRRPKSAT